jgi:hypothetical protein
MNTPLSAPRVSLGAVATIMLADALVLVWIIAKVVASVQAVVP